MVFWVVANSNIFGNFHPEPWGKMIQFLKRVSEKLFLGNRVWVSFRIHHCCINDGCSFQTWGTSCHFVTDLWQCQNTVTCQAALRQGVSLLSVLGTYLVSMKIHLINQDSARGGLNDPVALLTGFRFSSSPFKRPLSLGGAFTPTSDCIAAGKVETAEQARVSLLMGCNDLESQLLLTTLVGTAFALPHPDLNRWPHFDCNKGNSNSRPVSLSWTGRERVVGYPKSLHNREVKSYASVFFVMETKNVAVAVPKRTM